MLTDSIFVARNRHANRPVASGVPSGIVTHCMVSTSPLAMLTRKKRWPFAVRVRVHPSACNVRMWRRGTARDTTESYL
jgi:hypothetical protein